MQGTAGKKGDGYSQEYCNSAVVSLLPHLYLICQDVFAVELLDCYKEQKWFWRKTVNWNFHILFFHEEL